MRDIDRGDQAQNAITILRLAELMRGHVAELESEVEELRRRDAGLVKKS